mmetsp:Transcript_9411/g.13736  ORF Transcript_9411/g.13736 Transcript_9411/m.13736 type:complete len:116 (+) Transcript_9411:1614-1961(+)
MQVVPQKLTFRGLTFHDLVPGKHPAKVVKSPLGGSLHPAPEGENKHETDTPDAVITASARKCDTRSSGNPAASQPNPIRHKSSVGGKATLPVDPASTIQGRGEESKRGNQPLGKP